MFGALLEVEMFKKCTALWRKAHFEVKSVKKLAASGHFLKFRRRKSAPRCGEKQMSKSNCYKHTTFVPLLAVHDTRHDTTRHETYETYETRDARTRDTRHETREHETRDMRHETRDTRRGAPHTTLDTRHTTHDTTPPTTCRSISGFALPSMHHNNSPLL